MLDTAEQLARLRQRIAAVESRIAKKFAEQRAEIAAEVGAAGVGAGIAGVAVEGAGRRTPSPARWFIEEWSEGQVVETEFGAHFETERLFAGHRRHGSADIGALAELPHDVLDALSEGEIARSAPGRWAFLDTETTGLAGGTGTYAFLIGVGRIASDGFRVRQFLMREYVEEGSVLAALDAHLAQFDVLITYNGKSYDQPLLETRYRMAQRRTPFARLAHLDLLHGARRLWKLRLESCRLVELEQHVLGVLREGDLPGEMIPYVYFEYLRRKEAAKLVPIFHHNAIDILTLACLTGIVPAAFRSADAESLARLGVRRGEELAGIARWLIAAEQYEQGLALLRRAIEAGLPDALLFRSLWDAALIEKRLERPHAALEIFSELASCRNDFRVCALEELAKHYEHEQRNYAMALEFTREALRHGPSEGLEHRRGRLERKLAKPRNARLL